MLKCLVWCNQRMYLCLGNSCLYSQIVYFVTLQPNQVILTLTNPTDVLTHVTLLPCDPDTDSWSTAKVCHLNSSYLLSYVFIYLCLWCLCQSCWHCICGKLTYGKNLNMNCLHDDRPWTQESLIDVCVTVGVMVRVNDNVGRRTTLSCGSLVVTLLLLVLSSCLRFIVCANIFISSVYVCSDGS